MLTADHIISPLEEFRLKLDYAFQLVEDAPGRFVTFSITPTKPATQYGYVEHGAPVEGFAEAAEVERFVEKPTAAVAREYMYSGRHGWNSGMFVFGARRFLDALEAFLPESAAGAHRIAEAWGTSEQKQVLESVYPTLPRISVDYAVMEPASTHGAFDVCTVPMNIEWLDVGSWPSYGETLEADLHGSVTNARAVHLDSHNMIAVSDDPNHTIATIGCSDLIVVHTGDVTLVCPKSLAENVKDMAGEVDDSLR